MDAVDVCLAYASAYLRDRRGFLLAWLTNQQLTNWLMNERVNRYTDKPTLDNNNNNIYNSLLELRQNERESACEMINDKWRKRNPILPLLRPFRAELSHGINYILKALPFSLSSPKPLSLH